MDSNIGRPALIIRVRKPSSIFWACIVVWIAVVTMLSIAAVLATR